MDIDTLAKVLSRTVFSPFFTAFVPLLFRAIGTSTNEPAFKFSVSLLAFNLFCTFITWSSVAWRNRSSIFSSSRIDWANQIVLITGGASGVGALLAHTLAVRHVTVVVLDINPLATDDENITSYICDVSDWQAVQTVQKKITDEVGNPTILINNAGVVNGKLILDLSPKDIQKTFGVNVISHYNILQAFLPELIKQNSGHVITMASVLGEIGCAQISDYCASKAAVLALHESLRYELDKRYNAANVKTTVLLPGRIGTPMFATGSWPTNPLVTFLSPLLDTHTVVKAMIEAMDKQVSGTVRLPLYVYLAPWLKISPSYVRDFFQWLANADWVMVGFTSSAKDR